MNTLKWICEIYVDFNTICPFTIHNSYLHILSTRWRPKRACHSATLGASRTSVAMTSVSRDPAKSVFRWDPTRARHNPEWTWARRGQSWTKLCIEIVYNVVDYKGDVLHGLYITCRKDCVILYFFCFAIWFWAEREKFFTYSYAAIAIKFAIK